MCSVNHFGLYLNNKADKKHIIQKVINNEVFSSWFRIEASSCAVFSSLTVDALVDEEIRHDRFLVTSINNSLGLESMSSGQQKLAVLHYLISQKPKYLILDDVYANVDKQVQSDIFNLLVNISKEIVLIQIFFRRRDLLSFLDKVAIVNDQNEVENVIEPIMFLSEDQRVADKQIVLPQFTSTINNVNNPIVIMNSVSVGYESNLVLDNVNWLIHQGEFWQLKGPNGSGKSTLVTMISGDNPKAYGQDITLFGRKKGSGESIWDLKKQIGYFTPKMINRFQSNHTVEQMIISGFFDSVGLYQKPTDCQLRLVAEWVEILGVGFKGKLFKQLSIGQQRMVMVARAMIKHPDLLILDEPTIEMDDSNASVFVQMINAIAAENQVAIIYVSHQDEEGLKPQRIFELVPTGNGFTGKIY
jgi:molybdate transport system ATP-binding protein